MEALPDDIQWLIWRTYAKNHVMSELVDSFEFVWHEPSEHLKQIVSCDKGAIQHGHHELSDMIQDEDMWVFKDCVHSRCENCKTYGFPCTNLAAYGFRNMNIDCLFDACF